jgi:serine phosphatase RsbU (regulator of sigma subunit)
VLLVTGLLTTLAYILYQNNENRLLKLRAREVGLVLQAQVPAIQTPLASAAALADATGGNIARFQAFVTPYVGKGKQFVTISLWAPGSARPIVTEGAAPLLAASPVEAQSFMSRVGRTRTFSVVLLSSGGALRLGYAYRQAQSGYVVYGESPLAPSRMSAPVPASSPFSDLSFVIYLGRGQTPANLLTTDLRKLPPQGRKAVETVKFGDSALTLVVTPRGSLGGRFFELLPWIIAAVGALLALAAAIVADRLVRGRREAEALAASRDARAHEVSTLLDEQRQIAQTLQEAILPDELPTPAGLSTAGLYQAGTTGIEVGGDWYELIEVAEGCLVAIVGDVSGHGLRAATTMATLRTAAFAYAARDASPASILERLSELVARRPHNYFATVLCMRIAVEGHEITLASAGHLPPLVIDGERAEFAQLSVGPPVGAATSSYLETSIEVGGGASVIAFTDGLVERRGENIDDGLARLRGRAFAHRGQALAELLAKLNHELVPEHAHDDTAILAVRWQS